VCAHPLFLRPLARSPARLLLTLTSPFSAGHVLFLSRLLRFYPLPCTRTRTRPSVQALALDWVGIHPEGQDCQRGPAWKLSASRSGTALRSHCVFLGDSQGHGLRGRCCAAAARRLSTPCSQHPPPPLHRVSAAADAAAASVLSLLPNCTQQPCQACSCFFFSLRGCD
jgi:hypothetical protein